MSDIWGIAEPPNDESAPGTERVRAGTGDPVLDEIVRRLVAEFDPERIYLFGSRARGDVTADSDYDVVVVVPPTEESWFQRRGRAYGALWGVLAPVDVFVFTQAEFDWQAPVVNTIPSTVLRDGRCLHGNA